MVFSKLFGKKKQPARSTPLSLADLHKGDIFDYFMKSWQVKKVYNFDWGNEFFTKEYVVSAGDEKAFLSVEDDDELEILFSKKIKLNKLEPNVLSVVVSTDEAPKMVSLDGETYHLQSEEMAECYEGDSEYPSQMVSWTYEGDNDKVITIERWGEQELEASLGQYIEEYEISNLVPGHE